MNRRRFAVPSLIPVAVAVAVAVAGVWAAPAPTADPIDSTLFVAGGDAVRSFTKEIVIDAPVGRVYDAWTTSEGWSALYGAPSVSHIDLAIGGRYEWLFDGRIGSNGCQVLSYVPDRMVSFSWNAPPSQSSSRVRRTWVVVETFEEGPATTRVRLTHLGFGDGAEWDETLRYFDEAWDRVLGRLETAFASERAAD
ncbi:MAG TPA: SRPBCC domain-containing protein [Candidatus Polarisedimenticolaceae bacterium]|nr:SRPBCC domain-containing protein [Candidatus Polarisedimenticolaceae bacterium]